MRIWNFILMPYSIIISRNKNLSILTTECYISGQLTSHSQQSNSCNRNENLKPHWVNIFTTILLNYMSVAVHLYVSTHYPTIVIKIRGFLSRSPSFKHLPCVCNCWSTGEMIYKRSQRLGFRRRGRSTKLCCIAKKKKGGAYYYGEPGSKKGWNVLPTKVKYPN